MTHVGDHSVEVTFAPGERAKVDPLFGKGASGPRGRPPVRAVDADRLLAWQLYWRGENFWSGDEIWGTLPEMRTAFVKTDNVEFNKYIADRTRAPHEPRSGISGRTSLLSRSTRRCTSSIRTPELPLARQFARNRIVTRTTASGLCGLLLATHGRLV